MKVPFFDYTYYRIYYTFKRGKNSDPAFSALSVMILIFGGIFTYFSEQFKLYKYLPEKKGLFIIYAFVFLIMYFMFVYKKRYMTIEQRYINETVRQKSNGILFLVVLALITIGAYFGLFIIK